MAYESVGRLSCCKELEAEEDEDAAAENVNSQYKIP